MPVTEESRHRLHQKLDETIGEEDATTLMEHLPPVGWADVATKTDIEVLRRDIDHRFEVFEITMNAGFAQVADRLGEHDRRFDEHDRRFDEHDRRFDTIDRRLETIETSVRQQTIRLVMFLMAYGAVLVGAVAQIRGG